MNGANIFLWMNFCAVFFGTPIQIIIPIILTLKAYKKGELVLSNLKKYLLISYGIVFSIVMLICLIKTFVELDVIHFN